MKAFEVTLAAVIAAAGCSATPETFDESIIGSEEQEIYCEDCGGGGDPGGGGGDPGGGGSCSTLGGACATGIATTVAACYGCVGLVTCIACAGAAMTTVGACSEWRDRCVDGHLAPGDTCFKSNACESSGLHCVNNQCSQNVGPEGARCSTDRDCQTGTTCLLDSVGLDPRTGLPYGGVCHRPRTSGEGCADSAECQAGLICDRTTNKCRAPRCDETMSPQAGCTCTQDSQCPADAAHCVNGHCEGVTVDVCACDGSDPPGTCASCPPGGIDPGGGGPVQHHGVGWGAPSCWYFYEVDSWTVCATYGNQTECETTYELVLVDAFCTY